MPPMPPVPPPVPTPMLLSTSTMQWSGTNFGLGWSMRGGPKQNYIIIKSTKTEYIATYKKLYRLQWAVNCRKGSLLCTVPNILSKLVSLS